MEYACTCCLGVWDPHYQSQVTSYQSWKRFKGVHGARWVLSDYSYHSSVSPMLEHLKLVASCKEEEATEA